MDTSLIFFFFIGCSGLFCVPNVVFWFFFVLFVLNDAVVVENTFFS